MGQLVNIGEVVEGRYKILKPIADGGMGTVYLAEHWLIRRKVAIKILHADLATDVVMLRRFMNEALAAGTLGHPHIVESTDMGFTKQQVPFIVFEYLEGTSLADEIERLKRLPVSRTLDIALQIASALEAAHGAGIVHRDLKSDNIFLSSKGEYRDHVKVLDFGISRFLTAHDKTALGGNLLGTPEFMAPEQIMTPDQVDHRVDVYALGVLVYEMLTGTVPFVLGKRDDLDAAHALMSRVVHEEAPPLVIKNAPDGLTPFIAKLLAKRANDRHQTMTEVQQALSALGAAPRKRVASVPRAAGRPVSGGAADQTLSRKHLPPEELAREVQQLGKRWSLVGDDLVLTVHDREMTKLARVIGEAAAIADDMGQQPRVAIEYPRLRITLPGIPRIVDLVFAARLEHVLRENDS